MIRTHDANSILQTSRDILRLIDSPINLYYHWGNMKMSIHGAWEDLPPNVMGYCSDDADMEAEGGKVSKESL
jgi:hypothetical protein